MENKNKELKKTTLKRFCYYCGKPFIASNGRDIFDEEFCEYKNWKETTQAKSLRQQRRARGVDEVTGK